MGLHSGCINDLFLSHGPPQKAEKRLSSSKGETEAGPHTTHMLSETLKLQGWKGTCGSNSPASLQSFLEAGPPRFLEFP